MVTAEQRWNEISYKNKNDPYNVNVYKIHINNWSTLT